MEIAIIGGGIVGLGLALNLQQRGLPCRVYETVPEVKELGVGITLLPHAMRELARLGLQEVLEPLGIENEESCFFNRFGQLIYREPRGRFAGYAVPELGMHRGRLHRVLYEAARDRLGPGRILTDRRCVGVEQDDSGVTLHFRQTSTGALLPPVRAGVAIGCDGVNSTVRARFYPEEKVVFTGINTWRGVTRRPPILTGRTYMRVGSIRTGKIVIYPIIDDVDGSGNQLINWTTEIQTGGEQQNDWNKPGRAEDFIHIYDSWRFDWLDVADMIRRADVVFEYPMVDKDPIDRWSFGRVTLAGDAAHPMYPRGSNGSAQGLIDARVLAGCLIEEADPMAALRAYEAERAGPAGEVVRTNRTAPPDFINIRVEELTGDRPFDNLDDFITQEELSALSDRYKRVAGYSIDQLDSALR
ncbi:MAG: flavin-dependent oxidoreductase [Alphaproteobacteria bacterium]|nr:flavin-dependent oxidoreductase [Alphaproteobacteria bacterium]MBV9154429.1 flavin-dependent oxidoreductase [Alphaproteobacteria bacterium]